MAERYVVIHGHFYQPPRENPWLGVTLSQESADPFHDWNERIFSECYQPNASARILNDGGFTVGTANNYEYMSFNFGPTLADWFRKTHPSTWKSVTAADALSRERLLHGNAVACAYSHTILPLDIPFLRKTDIDWGLKSFETDFGRKAEGMWLPETAVNGAVIDELIARGMKFVLLVPSQIDKARPNDIRHEIDVAQGNIDPRYTYKIKRDGGQITAIIAHHEISQAVSFENLLSNSAAAADMIEKAFSDNTHHDQLVAVLCDGETFGHHQPFAERGLAHLLKYELPSRGIKVVNPGFLAENCPPLWEISIKDGREREGTAWSCSHGVDRWRADCGCGKEPGTTQAWRGPLREAFEFLSEKTCSYFNDEISKISGNPEGALANYPAVLDDYAAVDGFIEKYFGAGLEFDARRRALLLFEMIKNTLFTFTSCGWFWAEISGLEPVHNMACAARALEIYKKLSGEDMEEPFLKILEKAPSNAAFANGRNVYEKLVNPQKNSVYTYTAGCILQKLAEGPEKTWVDDNPFLHVFINGTSRKAEIFLKSTEEKMYFDYSVTDEEFPYAINLRLDGFSGDFSVNNVFSGTRNIIMADFWMKKIKELKDTYNSLLDYFLEFESVYHFFKTPIREIEPVIAKVMMYQLLEIEEFHNTKRIQVVKSLVRIVREHGLNLDGFYTRRCLKRSIKTELSNFSSDDFGNIELLSVLFDIYFLIPWRTKENIYHDIIFNKLRSDSGAVKRLSKEDRQFLMNICMNFRIDPAVIGA